MYHSYKMIYESLIFMTGIMAGFLTNLLVTGIKYIVAQCNEIKNGLDSFNNNMKDKNKETNNIPPEIDDDSKRNFIKINNFKPSEHGRQRSRSNFFQKEDQNDWFDTVGAENPHLVNIYRPIGENTIGSMYKNPIHNIRGNCDFECPKFVAPSWLQSTIDPDRSSRCL